MKKIFTALLIVVLPSLLFADNRPGHPINPNLPPYGTIDKNDLEMKTCSFDPEASAEILIDRCDMRYEARAGGVNDLKFVINYAVHRRIKILKEKGMDLANVKIPYLTEDNFEDIHDVKAETFNLDNNGEVTVTKVEKKQIYIQHVSKGEDEVVISMPDVKPGSVIEYSYIKTSAMFWNIPAWYFQSNYPVRYSYLQLGIPSIFNFTSERFVSFPFDIDTSYFYAFNMFNGVSVNGGVHVFSMKDIPAMREEPFMTTERDYLQRIIFQLSEMKYGDYEKSFFSTWDQLTSQLMESDYFGKQLSKNISGTRDFIRDVSAVPDPTKRMYQVYDYVRDNMNWNEEDSRGVADGKNVNKIWESKTGTSGEINLILINLLRQAGLNASPLLVSTRDHGKINTLYPFLDQFNKTVAYIQVDNRAYILDASRKYLPYELIPVDILNTEGFLISDSRKGWLPINDRFYQFKNSVGVMAKITPDGVMDGQVSVYSYDYSRYSRLTTLRKDGMKGFRKSFFIKDNSNLKTDTIKVENEKDDSLPLIQEAGFKMGLNSSGDYLYFNTNLFTGLDQNPFVANRRFSDVDFAFNQTYYFTGSFSLPEGYRLEELPQNLQLILPDSSIIFRRVMVADETTLSVRFSLVFKRPFFTRREYPALKEFYKKLFAMLDEQVVLKKKS